MMTACVTGTANQSHDEQYDAFLGTLQENFDRATSGAIRLFTTNADGLFDVFLATLPPDRRQHYRCNACRRFVIRFGGLVAISSDGAMVPIMWDPDAAPAFFAAAVGALRRAVLRAIITGVVLSEERTWGLSQNKSEKPPYLWRHMSVVPSKALVFRATPLQTAEQAMAEKLQDYQMLQRGLAEFPLDVARQAHTLLTTGQLYRSEKCIGVAKWFLDLHEARAATDNAKTRANLTWLAIATAPAGFCHIRSSIIGTMLEDLSAGLPFADIKRRFDEKMNPLQYQRPQAAPSAGNVAQAEKIVAALKTAGALERRFARIEDVQALWTPRKEGPKETDKAGVFGHLKTRDAAIERPLVDVPPTVMTWEKFARAVLPDAEAIEYYAPSAPGPYSALVTAVNADAPPILQWDHEEHRNPVSWYLYHGGSSPGEWGLTAGTFHRVTAITLQPSLWLGDAHAHQGWSVFLLLDGAKDIRRLRLKSSGGGFFPECLRSEYHAVRATMEAYAHSAVISGAEDATACGVKLQAGVPWDCLLRVTSRGGRVTYRLDRRD